MENVNTRSIPVISSVYMLEACRGKKVSRGIDMRNDLAV